MAAGDVGSIRTGGAAQGDAFTKREKGMEDYAIRERENAKIQELLRKIQDEEKQLGILKENVKKIHEQISNTGKAE